MTLRTWLWWQWFKWRHRYEIDFSPITEAEQRRTRELAERFGWLKTNDAD